MFTIVNGKLDLGEFELAIDFDTIGTLPTWNVLLQLGMSGSLPLFFLIKVQIMVLIGWHLSYRASAPLTWNKHDFGSFIGFFIFYFGSFILNVESHLDFASSPFPSNHQKCTFFDEDWLESVPLSSSLAPFETLKWVQCQMSVDLLKCSKGSRRKRVFTFIVVDCSSSVCPFLNLIWNSSTF